jgi:hypothetical protein
MERKTVEYVNNTNHHGSNDIKFNKNRFKLKVKKIKVIILVFMSSIYL